MKTILVPTDFSVNAKNAMKYAISLAKTMKAKIHLCHAIVIPEVGPTAGFMVWPAEDYKVMKKESDDRLTKYIQKISKDENLPMITYSSELGTVKQMVEDLAEKMKINLIVMGMAGASNFEYFMLGSNSLSVIENSKSAVVLVPKRAALLELKKIAFATDLVENEVNSIQKMANLFKNFNSDILLTHVKDVKIDEQKTQIKIDEFLNDVTCKVNYGKIYFKPIIAKDIDKGLSWITKNTQVNMLAIVHRKLNFFNRIIAGSHTKKLAKHIKIPLLVLPEDTTKIAW
jgi:nucleotide-binding universal stress UspA family protein